jgi:hypothetical protein
MATFFGYLDTGSVGSSSLSSQSSEGHSYFVFFEIATTVVANLVPLKVFLTKHSSIW